MLLRCNDSGTGSSRLGSKQIVNWKPPSVSNLCAWIRMRAGAEALDAERVRAFATGKLAHYKIPRYVMVVDDFPMTVTGKIRKVQMREESARILGLA